MMSLGFRRLFLWSCFTSVLAVSVVHADISNKKQPQGFELIKEAVPASNPNEDPNTKTKVWNYYLKLPGKGTKVKLCPEQISKHGKTGFDPSSLEVQPLDKAQTLFVIKLDTYHQGSGGWVKSGRIIVQLNKKHDGHVELYRNFHMAKIRGSFWEGRYIDEKILYDERAKSLTIIRTTLDRDLFDWKVPFSKKADCKWNNKEYYQLKTKKVRITNCLIINGQLQPLSVTETLQVEPTTTKVDPQEFAKFLKVAKIKPLNKHAKGFPIILRHKLINKIPTKTYKQMAAHDPI